MDFPQFHFYKQNKFYLSLVGQWPYDDENTKKILKSFTFLQLAFAFSSQLGALINAKLELELTLEIIPIFTATVWALISFFAFYVKSNEFEIIWMRIVEDWLSEITEEEIKIKESYARTGQIACNVLYVVVISCGLLLITTFSFASQVLDLISPLNESREHFFLFADEGLIDREKYYYLAVIRIYSGLMWSMVFVLANVSVLIIHMQHVYGMFVVLGYRLEHAIPDDTVESERLMHLHDSIFYHSVMLCFQRHKKAIEFADALDLYYAPHFTMFLICSLFMLCPTFVQINTSNILQIRIVLYTLVMIGFFLISMSLGQKLIDLSENIAEKAYFSPWYCVSPNLQKLLILIIRRCDVSCKITAGSLYVASLDCFRMVMQAGFTYYMALKQLRE